MISPDKILLEQIVSEKATEMQSHANQYTFRVAKDATRTKVKLALKETFKDKDLDIRKVNVLNVKPRIKASRFRRGQFSVKSGYKKAIVTLAPGQTLDLV